MFTTLSDAEIEALAKDSDAVLRYVICNRENANSIRNIAARARDAVLEIVPGVGHALLVEDFDETARSVARASTYRTVSP